MKKGDIALLLSIIILTAVVSGFVQLMKYQNDDTVQKIAVIRQNGKIIGKVNLNTIKESEKIVITSEYNNVITCENNRVRFEEANCPDKLCVKTGWIDSQGQIAACVPNRVSIKIEGEGQDIDGTSY